MIKARTVMEEEIHGVASARDSGQETCQQRGGDAVPVFSCEGASRKPIHHPNVISPGFERRFRVLHIESLLGFAASETMLSDAN
jgi:hypothetical protein